MYSNRTFKLLAGVLVATVAAVLLTTQADSQIGGGKNTVALQASSPGTSQSGHINVSGTVVANALKANGLQLGTTANAGDVLTADSSGNATWQSPSTPPAGSARIMHWTSFNTYFEGMGWAFDNDPNLFGGIPPSSWSDGNATANMISLNSNMLRAFLTRRSSFGSNAMVISETYIQNSSTNGRIVVALFRVRNLTSSTIGWPVFMKYTAYSGWGEMASVAVNGNLVFASGNSGVITPTIPIPPMQTSTVIFVAGSSTPVSVSGLFLRTCQLGFQQNLLNLPGGLEYVDDFATMP